MRLLKGWVLGVALSLGIVGAYAGPYEDGLDAAGRGDFSSAAKLVRKAADDGNAKAQLFLGLMYETGTGVPKDDQQAVAWSRKAAEQGHAAAQRSLGVMYANGRGVPKDDQQAVAWSRKAAEQGNAAAQSNLGLMYAIGTGVPKDDQQAYFWWLLSSAQGYEQARKNRDILESRLTPNQRAAAQAQARDWKPRKQ